MTPEQMFEAADAARVKLQDELEDKGIDAYVFLELQVTPYGLIVVPNFDAHGTMQQAVGLVQLLDRQLTSFLGSDRLFQGVMVTTMFIEKCREE